MAVLRKFVNELLTQLEEDIDRERLRNMLVYSKKLSAFEKKATLIRDALAEILDNDEDLAGMYLTEKSRGKQRDVDQHDEVELLLEAYVKQIDGIVQEADQLASNMRNTEEIVNIILDANRNSLMLLDLKVPPTLFVALLTIGIYDDVGDRGWCCDCGVTWHELEKFHGRL
jgi:magnesium transporter